MKKLFGVLFTVVMCFALVSCSSEKAENSTSAEDTTSALPQTDWETVFRENEFSDDEISEYKEIFDAIGISDYHDVDIH